MKLKEYLDENGIRHSFFADKIQVNKQQLHHYLKGTTPNIEIIARIEIATGGKVKPYDWLKDKNTPELQSLK